MKKLWLIVLLCTCLLFSGCNTVKKTDKAITCDDVVLAYQEAGYSVFHKEYEEPDEFGAACYLRIDDKDSDDYIYFEFFQTHEEAVEYSEKRQYNVAIWLFSVIYGEPTWVTTKVYNQIEYEYWNAELEKPFLELIR